MLGVGDAGIEPVVVPFWELVSPAGSSNDTSSSTPCASSQQRAASFQTGMGTLKLLLTPKASQSGRQRFGNPQH